jgi:hypothetical protein
MSHHVKTFLVEPAPAAIVKEARILKPGGMMVVTDLGEHRHRLLLPEHHNRWPGFKRDEVRVWLQAAGLKDANVTCAGNAKGACMGAIEKTLDLFNQGFS